MASLNLLTTSNPSKTAIAKHLMLHSCTAQKTCLLLKTDPEAVENCRICLEPLAGEDTLRHTVGGVTAEADSIKQRACNHGYHLSCLVKWAENNIKKGQPVTCPVDRQLLIPVSISDFYHKQLHIEVPMQHPTRVIEDAVRFWLCAKNSGVNSLDQPLCQFDIMHMEPDGILTMASHGMDVGLISAEVVNKLDLDGNVRKLFNRLSDERYTTYIYVQVSRDLVDHFSGEEWSNYIFSPVRRPVARVISRYLLGMLGQIYSINQVDNYPCATVMSLTDNEVINLHAESRVRERMIRSRSIKRVSRNEAWHCAFPNNSGGIVIGDVHLHVEDHLHQLTSEPYQIMVHAERGPELIQHEAAIAYQFRGLNIGQANDERFARLVATKPELNAQGRSDNLVARYGYHGHRLKLSTRVKSGLNGQ